MECCKPQSHWHKSMKFLVGPVRKISEQDMKIYQYAVCCLPEPKANVKKPTKYIHQNDDIKMTSPWIFVPLTPLPPVLHQQSYSMWKASLDLGFCFRRIKAKPVIYLQPLDDFPDFITNYRFKGTMNFFELLQEVSRIFFLGLDIRIRPAFQMAQGGWKVKSRHHHKTKKLQHLVGDIHRNLKTILPNDGYCILGISWTDLYPCEDLNFVLGEASTILQTGAFSFGRFEPKAFYGDEAPPVIEKIDGQLLWKMFKVLTHETCHIYGMAHCFYFECAMNESSSVAEAMAQPFFLCPVCLRKLQKICKFDLKVRYQQLYQLMQDLQEEYHYERFERCLEWLEECLSCFQDWGNGELTF